MRGAPPLLLDKATREALWRRVGETIEAYIENVASERVAPELDPGALRRLLAGIDFERPIDPIEAVEIVAAGLLEHQVHTPHPSYYGLFNPAPTTMGIAADALVAAFNPQLAAWSHNPFAAETESHLVQALGGRFGYAPGAIDGTFASGGAEANHTALLAALVARFPSYARGGARALPGSPVFYVSAESHHSFLKASRLCGIGDEALQEVAVGSDLGLDTAALEDALAADRRAGRAPFLLVATAGTTGAGAIDPIPEMAEIAARERLWLHVDAAWGGAAALVPELRSVLTGIERSDSITFDAHKWLSVPMGAGLFLTRHPDILDRTFRTAADYMPLDAAGLDVTDPYTHSMQWSRRFIGLKVFLSLAVAGWAGYEAAIRRQTAMGDLLRAELDAAGWSVVNRTPLPLVCFADRTGGGDEASYLEAIRREVVGSGRAWISTVRLGTAARTALRACVTNYGTGPEEIRALVALLGEARGRVRAGA